MTDVGPRVPIIIINWNGFDDTVACIESIFESSYENYHIYLVDNASDKNEGIRLQAMFVHSDKVEVWLSESNMGFAKANNWVMSSILSLYKPYVVLLNNDTIVDSEWLEKLVSSAKRRKAHVVSSMLINYYNEHTLDNAGHQMLNTGEIIPVGHGLPAAQFQDYFENLGSCAAATLYDLEMIRDLGFFDDYFSTGYEDAEFGLRAYLGGYHCTYEPTAKVRHKLGTSIKKVFNTEYASMIQRSIWYTYFKLVPLPVILLSLPFILIKQFLIFVINLVFFRWKYIKIQVSSWAQTLHHRKAILNERRTFKPKIKRTSLQLLSQQTFFLSHDMRRFISIYVKGQSSALDQYGSGAMK